MRSVDGRWGKVWFYGRDWYVGRALYHYGEYSPDETEKILELAGNAREGICLDIGANFGCIGQALESAGHQVVAFEPQRNIYNMTRMNIHGTVYNCALGSEVGIAKMPKTGSNEDTNYGGMGLGMAHAKNGTVDVEVCTLDGFAFDNVYFMKIDVEGYEEQVIRGGVEMIKKCKPIMYVEDDRPEKSKSLRELIISLGYTIEEHHPLLFRDNNFFKNKINIWNSSILASHNIICTPC